MADKQAATVYARYSNPAQPFPMRGTGLGQAFWYGYDHPERPPVSPRVGAPTSLARAAWRAGRDRKRAEGVA
jgi:hypothetical protein